MSAYRTTPVNSDKMPPGIPYIISNEAAERFSYYGMRAALAVFLANYLGVMGGSNFTETESTAAVSYFTMAVYFTPLLGAIIADCFAGKYRTIVTLSVVYCAGHASLAMMGVGGVVKLWLMAGLGLIALGAGGIKPCVSAHVGDQFGTANQHLLTKIFNIFYFSINLGSAIATMLIPWVLEWHGPHWAFGIPGVLMALATIFFWMGRSKFIHVPAKGASFIEEIFSREGMFAIAKLAPLLLFIGMFWCLFDQTSTTWIFQSENMNRNFFGWEPLPSQIQTFNPVLILTLIPIFTFFVYPALGKLIELTSLRKIGIGLFLTVGSYIVISLCQEAIDSGKTPHFTWQLLAYVFLTSGEIMISIVGLEFFYTQAPKRMKSFIMAIFLFAVSIGNLVTGIVNDSISIPTAKIEKGTSAGFDGEAGTADDFSQAEDGVITSPVTTILQAAAAQIVADFEASGTDKTLPRKLDDLPTDPWGNQLVYKFAHATEARIYSLGPDGKDKTEWNLGITLTVKDANSTREGTWLHREKLRLGLVTESQSGEPIDLKYTAGGGVKLEGAAYFWFFTKLMLVAGLIFIPYAVIFKPRTYLQDESDPDEDLHPTKP